MTPVRFPFWGVKTTISGVDYNIVKALTVPGNDVDFVSLIGTDKVQPVIRQIPELATCVERMQGPLSDI